MRDALQRLKSDALIYGAGQALGRGVQFLLVPILTRVLAPEVYGVSDLVLAYSQFVVLTLVFGTDAALVRFFYQEPDRDARRRMISASLLFRMALGLAATLIFTLLAGVIAHQFLGSDVYRKYVMIGAWTLPWSLLVLFVNDVLRVTFQPVKFVSLNITQAVVTGALSWWLVAHRGLGVAGILYGKLAGDACAALLGLALIRLSVTRRPNFATLGRMLRFGAPLIPAALAYGVISAADRYFLQHTRSLAEVGVYAVAVKFFSLVMLGVQAFSLAFFPFAHARA
ncbi:MAG: lipopolysaccharide biosynthesis protein, partial [Candidatus Eiseniibacteriota bacterium]